MARLRVEVVYAQAAVQDVVTVDLEEGATAREAVQESGLLARHPEIDLRPIRLGMFGRAIRPDVPVREGDRIEILRPLAIGPKEARRLRARRQRR
ncbi:MAG: RnfH family protein [Betaproteobacteria bacterium]|nr:RnfH family protein [Betaproteobacteria bacterium]